MAELRFIKSQKGFDMLVDGGCLFRKEKEYSKNGKIIWKCMEYKNIKCCVRKHTQNNRIVKSVGEHNHVPNISKVEAKVVLEKIKQKAIASQESSSLIISQCSAEVTESVLGQLPNVELIKRTIRRSRQENCTDCFPNNSLSLEELFIPDEYKIILNDQHIKEQFLLFDSGAGNDRILIFSTTQNLQFLTWYSLP